MKYTNKDFTRLLELNTTIAKDYAESAKHLIACTLSKSVIEVFKLNWSFTQ